MEADRALARRLTVCRTTSEWIGCLIDELDRLGYVESWAYLRIAAPELLDGEIDERLRAGDLHCGWSHDLNDQAFELEDQAQAVAVAATELREAVGRDGHAALAAKIEPIASQIEAGVYEMRQAARDLRHVARRAAG